MRCEWLLGPRNANPPMRSLRTRNAQIAPGGRGNTLLRRFDETLGVALLKALGALHRQRQLDPDPRRIGIMKSTGIGDMVLATAIARDVIARFPDSRVVIFAGADNAAIARLVEGAEVVELATAKPWTTLPLLRAERLDALIDLGQWTRLEALYAALSGAGWTAGFATGGQRRDFAFDATVPHSAAASELDNYRNVAAALGVRSESLPRFAPSGEPPPLPAAEPFVIFHVWPGGFRSGLREWPVESWRELIRRAHSRGLSVLLTGGPEDVGRTMALIASCGGPSDRLASIAGRFGIAELIDVVGHARCVVSVNTGVMHLAAAVGTWTIALNGPTSSSRWGPIGPRTINIDSPLPGCGFLNLGFEYDGQRIDCMQGITVDRVEEALTTCIDG